MSLIASIKRDIKAAFEHDPVGEKLESLERRMAKLEQRLATTEGSKDEGI